MEYKYEDKLREKTGGFIKELKKEGLKGEIDQIRDYMLKLAIRDEKKSYGRLTIYYSPTKDAYTLKENELTGEKIYNQLRSIWTGAPINNLYKAYVDGSYINGGIGYGIVILKGEEVVEELFGPVTSPLAQSSRQVGGELVAVEEALKWCKKKGIKELEVYYDLKNIKKWATGEYKANIPLTKNFKSFIDKSRIKITWHKVKAHSGVKWNERADELAKKGAGEVKGGKGNKLVKDLEQKAEEFTDYIQRRGFSATFKGIYNSNCAKLAISTGVDDIGHMNIYNTKKLSLIPKYHELVDKSYQDELESLWKSFVIDC
ncbi:RNase H family protein [Halonatronum saccharophilum]|uniref:RNase H family protein n=1 Tax=Halonatronum saccharophilum TaxID=150060 RepID=UPI0004B81994|nr:RNase H family protein [Halonatronum saccharophilum]